MTRMPYKSAEETEAATQIQIKQISTPDGRNWKDSAPVNLDTDKTPALGDLNGTFYAIYRGRGTDTQLYYATSKDGIKWGQPTALNVQAVDEPCCAVFNADKNRLYCAYPASDTKVYAIHTDGATWSTPQALPDTFSKSTPELVVFNKKLYCFTSDNIKSPR